MAMVAIWDRSPHSARKVRVKAWAKVGDARLAMNCSHEKPCGGEQGVGSQGGTPV